ncbi:immunoglobulin lambda-1 light chain-like isoform X2 [Amphiprion ocellaris]|uniref:immunoglobulin lambda-1 light chain-like isoform X2 n=1 Tax=Amphiprion ocellaris TaxID=80972 RepID=UPI0024117E8B|nr:immunoglobulin lambda-1 light chain-like isoform X2 [Amphiprion ocellaris]
MLLLPAAALCCLCSGLVAMAAQLIQDDLTLTRRVGESASFSCKTDQCGTYVFWYQKKESETFRVILRIDRTNGQIYSGYNHPQKNDFSAVKKQNGVELKLENVKLQHSASYYCSCYISGFFTVVLIFGSGTKLYVTDEQVVKPMVSVYPAASTVHLEGKSSLLCLASAMFPPLVRFSWKRQKEDERLEDVDPAEGEQLEIREPGRSASIWLIHQQQDGTYKYSCYVQHEGGTVEAQTQQELPELQQPTDSPTTSVPCEKKPAASVPSESQVKLLCLLSTVLIVKSLVFCCGISLMMILTNKGPSTNCTHAD